MPSAVGGGVKDVRCLKTSIISGSIICKNYTKSDHELTNRDNTTGDGANVHANNKET